MSRVTPSIKVSRIGLSKVKGNAILLGFFKEKLDLSPEFKKLDNKLDNIMSFYIKNNNFKGEKGEIKNIFINKDIKNIVLVGLGEEDKYNLDILSAAIADVSKILRDNGIESFSIYLNSFNNKFKDEEIIEKITLSSLMGLYRFVEYKTKDKAKIKSIKQISIITNTNKNYDKEINYASVFADAVNKTRDLVNTPPNIATPEYIADYAKEIGKNFDLKVKILDYKQIKKLKMGCFLGVAQGSVNKPFLVVLSFYSKYER
ncbi:hypothetical protein HYW99_01925 [Candidatus Woesearchaeota archaeon]|nr:hypothetical protein [Candidatus Woesearchaeota archaeon]